MSDAHKQPHATSTTAARPIDPHWRVFIMDKVAHHAPKPEDCMHYDLMQNLIHWLMYHAEGLANDKPKVDMRPLLGWYGKICSLPYPQTEQSAFWKLVPDLVLDAYGYYLNQEIITGDEEAITRAMKQCRVLLYCLRCIADGDRFPTKKWQGGFEEFCASLEPD